MGPPTKKLRLPECSAFEAIQLLFQAFFNILKNKRDIQEKRLRAKFPER